MPPVRPASVWLDHRLALVAIVLLALTARVAWLDEPRHTLIFDEQYYVNAARVIVGWPVAQDAPYAGEPVGLDPNLEHPPLGKVLIAGSMSLLGDNAGGWRMPSLVAGTASIVLLYLITRAARADGWLAVTAAGLFAADNLALVHSRIGTLDMPLVAFLLFGAWCALRGWPIVGGVACALAALTKLSGIYGLAALLLFQLLLAARVWRASRRVPVAQLKASGLLLLGFLVAWLAGWWLLDLVVTSFRSPWDHLRYILDFGLSLSRPDGPANAESSPWQWLLNDVQMPYLRVDQQLKAGEQLLETRSPILFRGAMNPVIIGVAPLAVAYSAWRAWRSMDVLALWTVAWILGTYVPFFPMSLVSHRITYIFYFLPTLPAVAVASAQFLRQAGLPRAVQLGYLGAVLLGFVGYFPFRAIPS